MISEKDEQLLIDYIVRLNDHEQGLEGVSDQEAILRIMASFVLSSSERIRRLEASADRTRNFFG
jgi:hypothetical protein